jgi:hypothetical protein
MITPGALSRRQAQEYVGGRCVFDMLVDKYPSIAKPFYRTRKTHYYRRAALDTAMEAAELNAEGTESA